MTLTEPIFANLFTLLAATQMLDVNGNPTGGNAFQTTSRKLPPVADVSAAIQPALYILEGDETEDQQETMGLARAEMTAAVVVFFRTLAVPVPSTLMNQLRDAVVYQLTQKTLNASGAVIAMSEGDLQQLGGVCQQARIKGRILKNEGLQNGQGALVFPLSILTGY